MSQEIGLFPAFTLERVKKMEKMSVFKSYHAAVDNDVIRFEVDTSLLLTLTGHNKKNLNQFMQAINQIEEVSTLKNSAQ